MGRRYFYHIVDETYAREERLKRQNVGSWQGYEGNEWYQKAREKTGRKRL